MVMIAGVFVVIMVLTLGTYLVVQKSFEKGEIDRTPGIRATVRRPS